MSQQLIDALLLQVATWLRDGVEGEGAMGEGVMGEGVEGEGDKDVLFAVVLAEALYLRAVASRGRGHLREAWDGYKRCACEKSSVYLYTLTIFPVFVTV